DGDDSVAAFGSISLNRNHSSFRVKLRVRGNLAHGCENLFCSPRDKQIRAVGKYAKGNLSDLFSGLALPENDFREPKPQVAMVVNTREGDVFVGKTRHLCRGVVDVYTAVAYLFE